MGAHSALVNSTESPLSFASGTPAAHNFRKIASAMSYRPYPMSCVARDCREDRNATSTIEQLSESILECHFSRDSLEPRAARSQSRAFARDVPSLVASFELAPWRESAQHRWSSRCRETNGAPERSLHKGF